MTELSDALDRIVPWLVTITSFVIVVVIAYRRIGGPGDDVPKRYKDLLDSQAQEFARQLAERDRRDAERDRREVKRDEDILVLREWVSELTSQLVGIGQRPITEYEIRRKLGLVGPRVAAASGPVVDPHHLVDVLANRFTLAEMQSLAFELGVPWEEIPGAVSRSKAEGLTAWMKNRSRLDDLLHAVKRARPQEFPE